MHFQVRTDNHITSDETMVAGIRAEVEATLLHRYGDRLRRVEVYLHDTNSHKGGIDKDVTVEVHLAGLQPIAVRERGTSLDETVSGALDKMQRTLEHTLGRLSDRGGHESMSGQQAT